MALNIFEKQTTIVDPVNALIDAIAAGKIEVSAQTWDMDNNEIATVCAFGAAMNTAATQYNSQTINAAIMGAIVTQSDGDADVTRADVVDYLMNDADFVKANVNDAGEVPVATLNRAWALAVLALYGTRAQVKTWGDNQSLLLLGSKKAWGKKPATKAGLAACVETLEKTGNTGSAGRTKNTGGAAKEKSDDRQRLEVAKAENKQLAQAATVAKDVAQQATRTVTEYERVMDEAIACLMNTTLADNLARAKALETLKTMRDAAQR